MLIYRSSMVTLRFLIISIRSNLISRLFTIKIGAIACSDLFNRRQERCMLTDIIIFRRSSYLRKMKSCRIKKRQNNRCWVTKGRFTSVLKNHYLRYRFIYLSNKKGRDHPKRLEEDVESLTGSLQRNKKRMKLSKHSFTLLKDLWMWAEYCLTNFATFWRSSRTHFLKKYLLLLKLKTISSIKT